MRKSPHGGIRNAQEKLSYDFYEPRVEQDLAVYLHAHSFMPDGSRRSVSNWQKGMFGVKEDMQSLQRHLKDLEALTKGYSVFKEVEDGEEITHYIKDLNFVHPDWEEVTFVKACCAVRFNICVIHNDYLLGLE